MSAENALLHVGYHKTGTTWLQRRIFAVGALGLQAALQKKELHPLLVDPRPLEFDPESCRKALEGPLRAAAEDGGTPVLSSEELCGSPHTGGVYSKEFAERLAAVLPAARVLIVVREQRAMIASTYKQYVRAGGTLPLSAYLSPGKLGDIRVCLPDWRHFRFHHLVGLYRRLFGPTRVLVLPYEVFRAAPVEFLSRVLTFCGRPSAAAELERLEYAHNDHASLGAFATAVKRPLNRLLARPDRMRPKRNTSLVRGLERLERCVPTRGRHHSEERLRRRVAEWAGDRFQQSNATLDSWTPDDLAELGYDR